MPALCFWGGAFCATPAPREAAPALAVVGSASPARGDAPPVSPERDGAEIVLVPGVEPARQYRSCVHTSVRPPPRVAPFVAAVQAAATGQGKPPPEWRPALARVCRDLATVVTRARPLDYRFAVFALQHYGIMEPTPHFLTVFASRPDVEGLAAHLRSQLESLLATDNYSSVGLGIAPQGPGVYAVVVGLQSSYIELAPVDRALPADGMISLCGRLRPPFGKPEVLVTRADGQVEVVPTRRTPDHGMKARVDCDDKVGPMQIEVSGESQRGSAVLANFPVYCGMAPPHQLRLTGAGSDATLTNTDQLEARLVELVNRDRARAGLRRLRVDPDVSAVARAYSQEMARTGAVVHVSPESGTAEQRLRAAGLVRPLVQENLARSSSAEEAHNGLMGSPGHRANILSLEVTHVGVGVAIVRDVVGSRDLIVTELFVRTLDPIDSGAARRRVERAISDHRSWGRDRTLSRMAQSAVQRVVSGEAENAAPLQDELRAVSGRFRRVRAILLVVSDVDSILLEKLGHDPVVTHFGVGVAQGTHPRMGQNAIHVVVMLGLGK